MSNKKKQPVALFYHRMDYDGLAAGAVLKTYIETNHFGCRLDMFPYHYGEPLDGNVNWQDYQAIYIVDVTCPLLDMPELERKIIWIDHHKTSIDKYDVPVSKFQGLRIDGVAACRLAWSWAFRSSKYDRYHFTDRVIPREPLILQLLGEYDVFDHRDERGKPLQLGLKTEYTDADFMNLVQDTLMEPKLATYYEEKVANAVKVGRTVQKYIDSVNSFSEKILAHDLLLNGILFACMNRPGNSLVFGDYVKDRHQALMLWSVIRTGVVKVSMYSKPGGDPNLDLSVIAKQYNGGGHRGACGFEIGLPQWSEFLVAKRNQSGVLCPPLKEGGA